MFAFSYMSNKFHFQLLRRGCGMISNSMVYKSKCLLQSTDIVRPVFFLLIFSIHFYSFSLPATDIVAINFTTGVPFLYRKYCCINTDDVPSFYSYPIARVINNIFILPLLCGRYLLYLLYNIILYNIYFISRTNHYISVGTMCSQ